MGFRGTYDKGELDRIKDTLALQREDFNLVDSQFEDKGKKLTQYGVMLLGIGVLILVLKLAKWKIKK